MTTIDGHGGEHAAAALTQAGVTDIFTLIGGHIFSVLDGAKKAGMKFIDVRHESAAAFAAEAYGKLARTPGVALTDAGPGVLNTTNAIASAYSNGAPMLLLCGRPPRSLWGMGALNEVNQHPIFEPITKRATSVASLEQIAQTVADGMAVAGTRHRGPVYVDLPMDYAMGSGTGTLEVPKVDVVETTDMTAVADLLGKAERPVLFLGSDVWADGAEQIARALAEKQQLPVFMNGMGRGIVPADHPLAFSASRGAAFKQADLVIVVGVPMDFRVGFGGVFANTTVVQLADHPSRVAAHVPSAATATGPLADLLGSLMDVATRDRTGWIGTLRDIETTRRAAFTADLANDSNPIHPARVYGSLVPQMARDTIVIADGGDFASYAGKYVDVFEPGGWLDPGPYGCLGTSAGYALAAGTLYPDRRIVVLLGDGAAGFSLADWDSLVRHQIDVTFVCGNNSGWVLEKEPMRLLYGYELLAELGTETRYDEVMKGFGGAGELVREPGDLDAAIGRALNASGPSLVNVITDGSISYPRGGSAS